MSATTAPVLPTTAARTKVHYSYHLITACAVVLAVAVIWTAALAAAWQVPLGQASFVLASTSIMVAVAGRRCKSHYYAKASDLPKRDWPFAAITYINISTDDVLESVQAKTIASDRPHAYYAWRNLRPSVTMLTLALAVLSCLTLVLAAAL